MFERFTEPARQVVVLAQHEARELGHDWIGAEHMLLGLLHEQPGADPLARRVLSDLGLDGEEVKARVVALRGTAESPATGQIPFTPHAKRALEWALREAVRRKHDYIGSEHILLGLTHAEDPDLEGLGFDSARVADEVQRHIG
jgi:ATP-dependent Clp protease ATP-binding subunit ClpC